MSKTPHVLIIEDDHFLVKMYNVHLTQAGCSVDVGYNGEEGLQKLTECTPDIILLDLLMPKMDGYGFLESAQKKGIDIPIIILTNLSQDIDREKCKAFGVKDYFVKSDMDLEQLSSIIQKHL